jgi:1-phosphatidylinositol-4-phosphate 5-kinase
MPTFRSNREMFAAMSLQSGTPSVEASKPVPAKDERQEENSDKIIRCMKHALRTSLTNISMEQKERPLNPTIDFGFKAKVTFGRKPTAGCCSSVAERAESDTDDDSDDDASDLGTFHFTDYAPMCYRHIREFFGVEWRQFQDVLCSSTWHSIPTPGKSTAQLFFCGQNWVVKTMTKEESKFLREILHRYYYHVRDNPCTLLPHFVGHHSLELELNGSTSKISFVIMQNVFATPNKIHEKFDLKGSTVGRFATPQERLKQTCTKKDLDVNRPMRLGTSLERFSSNRCGEIATFCANR